MRKFEQIAFSFRNRVSILFLTLLLGAASQALAENRGAFDYPELMVTPSATKRIKDEASEEGGRRWTNLLPLYAPALTTFMGGVLQASSVNRQSDPGNYSALIGGVVGGTWLTIYTLLALAHHPYKDAQAKLAKMPKRTKRERLARERFAEQALYRPAKLVRMIAWTQFFTNTGANIYMLSQSKGSSINSILPAFSIGMAILPFFFKSHWQDVANEHKSYKKRIYGPIVNGTIFKDQYTNELTPGVAVSLRF